MASNFLKWSERELILQISEIFADSSFADRSMELPELLVGIGDDGAVVARPKAPIVVTTDMAVEEVHFKKEWSSAKEIGRKIAAANLADIYGMGGKPKYLTVAMAATGNEELEWMLDIARGIAQEVQIVGAQVIGGDLSKSDKIIISITAIGECSKPILRSGAKVGDSIFISNLPGWSAAGLLALQKNLRGAALDFAIAEHRAPSVDYHNAEQIAVGANSLCDISDSLMIQGEQIADASNVQLEIDGKLFSGHPDFEELSQVADMLNVSIFDLILSGGEDHIFLATGKALDGFEIGKVLPGSGIRLLHVATPQPGWQHFK